MHHLLVAQVCNELEAAHCHGLVIALEGLQELHGHTGMSMTCVMSLLAGLEVQQMTPAASYDMIHSARKDLVDHNAENGTWSEKSEIPNLTCTSSTIKTNVMCNAAAVLRNSEKTVWGQTCDTPGSSIQQAGVGKTCEMTLFNSSSPISGNLVFMMATSAA